MHEHREPFRPASIAVICAAVAIAAASCAHPPGRLAAPAEARRDGDTPARALTRGHPLGIWKAAVPPRRMNGEFDDFDPLGIAAGARIKADCSLNWTNPDDGKLYCFSSGTSLEVFLEEPQVYIERARRAWRKMDAA
ncbi:MAG TPA: hypothetical protein VMV25_12575 [Steroidobacteraceae bacterium]|nr:hypothetical protein [Steroidobacteraceae bacterium]